MKIDSTRVQKFIKNIAMQIQRECEGYSKEEKEIRAVFLTMIDMLVLGTIIATSQAYEATPEQILNLIFDLVKESLNKINLEKESKFNVNKS